jgi:glycerate kinase
MKLVVCMDSWKGSLSAREANAAVAAGLREGWPDAEILEIPLADGGEGTLDIVQSVRPGQVIRQAVCGPLADLRVDAPVLLWPERNEALVEVAACAGLTLLADAQRDPLRTTTRGAGELIAVALARGARKILLAVGGTATVDAGAGLAMALGWRFLDRGGQAIPPGGGGLLRLDRILPPLHPGPAFDLEVLCDVDNPLLGPRGAAPVFGPQKGAGPDGVARLSEALARFADVVERDLGVRVGEVPGTGAAGGIPACALACFGATLSPGIDRLLGLVGFDAALAGADWVITGEGKVDAQSLSGKVLSGVLRAARAKSVPVGVIAGGVELGDAEARQAGVHRAVAARPPGMPLETALREAAPLARQAGLAFARRGKPRTA